jgi:glycosyltransferase involved in cell wall biosynthesis
MNNANKIIIVANSTWSLYNFRFNLVEAIKKNHNIKILSNKDEFLSTFINNNYLFEEFSFNRKSKNVFKIFLNLVTLLFKIKKYNPKLIISFGLKPNLYSVIIGKILKIKTIPTFTGLGTLYLNNNFSQKLIIILFKFFLNKKHKVIFHNKGDVDIFKKWNLINNNFIVTSGSGINFEKFNNSHYDVDKDIIKFIMISRLIKDKGIFEFINAAKLIKDEFLDKVEFKLVGEVDVENYSSINSKDLIELQKNNIIKYYNFSNNVIEHILDSHCLILPSYREGTSKIIMEAQALGRPIITTDVPGCNDLVIDGFNGFTCKVKNHNDLYLKLKKFINLSKDEKTIMSTNAYNYSINNFDEKLVINEYIQLINIYE